MKKLAMFAMVTVAVLLLAVPAGAQDPDPYGEVLPRDVERPAETTVAPDDGDAAAARPGDVVQADAGTLPRTGFTVTVGSLLLAVLLLASGGGAVLAARRRARSAG